MFSQLMDSVHRLSRLYLTNLALNPPLWWKGGGAGRGSEMNEASGLRRVCLGAPGAAQIS